MILTATDQYKRIINLNEAEQKASNYHKKLRIRDYKPGQVIYHLGDYPHPFKIEPTEYDEKLIKQYHDRGYELIQLHTDWAAIGFTVGQNIHPMTQMDYKDLWICATSMI